MVEDVTQLTCLRGSMRTAPLLLLLTGLAAAGASHAATLRVALNHSVRLPVSGPASSVVLGSPSVVDVSVVDSRTVFVSGKTPGSTDVTVVDPLGRIVYRGDIVVGESSGSTVRVFRGGAVTDVACSPSCSGSAGGSGAAAPPAPATAGASPAAALSAALGSNINGAAASGVASIGQNLPLPR